jgi:glycerophosphoryl diester phosphodiesterase
VNLVFDPHRRLVLAHRGGAGLRPENTLAAFDHAAALGADGVECDVHLARDGELVVIHDATLDRTTDAQGPVADRTADELARVDAAARFTAPDGATFAGQGFGVPRLRDLLRRFPQFRFVIELKGTNPAVGVAAARLVAAEGALDRVCFGGFDDGVVQAARGAVAGVVSSAATNEILWALYRSYVRLSPRAPAYQGFQLPERYAARRIVSERFMRVMRRAGLPVQVWTVNTPDDIRRLLGWGVQAIITDLPDMAVPIVRGW